MNRRRKIYDGKAKTLYEGPEPGTLIQYFKDDATAGNGARHEVIDGKGDGAVAIKREPPAVRDGLKRPTTNEPARWITRTGRFSSVTPARLRRCSAGSRSSPSWQPCSPRCRQPGG